VACSRWHAAVLLGLLASMPPWTGASRPSAKTHRISDPQSRTQDRRDRALERAGRSAGRGSSDTVKELPWSQNSSKQSPFSPRHHVLALQLLVIMTLVDHKFQLAVAQLLWLSESPHHSGNSMCDTIRKFLGLSVCNRLPGNDRQALPSAHRDAVGLSIAKLQVARCGPKDIFSTLTQFTAGPENFTPA
jgi:hypothetical protein